MIEELKRRTAAGERVKYVFFWGHQPRRDGAECLSQWAPSPFTWVTTGSRRRSTS